MATKTAPATALRVNDRVVSREPLRGVPEGTEGKVIHIQGLTWTRYWVWFDNGERVGTIDRSKLATAAEWNARFDEPTITDTAVKAGAGTESGGAADGSAKGAFGVPEYLFERSRKARERLGVPKK